MQNQRMPKTNCSSYKRKQHGNKEDYAQDGEKRFNITRIKTGRERSENFENWEILRWKPECTIMLRLRGGGGEGGGG